MATLLERMRTLLGVNGDATEDAVFDAATALKKQHDSAGAAARIDGTIHVLKIVAKAHGRQDDIDWNKIRQDPEARTLLTAELAKPPATPPPAKKDDAGGKDGKEQGGQGGGQDGSQGKTAQQLADEIVKEERKKLERQMVTHHTHAFLNGIGNVRPDLVGYVAGQVNPELLQISRDASGNITKVTIPDDEMKRVKESFPSAFDPSKETKKEPGGNPPPNTDGGGGGGASENGKKEDGKLEPDMQAQVDRTTRHMKMGM